MDIYIIGSQLFIIQKVDFDHSIFAEVSKKEEW